MAFRTNELAVRTKYDGYASRAMPEWNSMRRIT